MTSLSFPTLSPLHSNVADIPLAHTKEVSMPVLLHLINDQFIKLAKAADGYLMLTRDSHPQSKLRDAIDPLYDPPEAAEYLGIKESTLAVWRCMGRYGIEYIKVGRLVKYRKSALDAFLERRTRSQAGGV